jgi:hypothetical protein
VLGSTLPSGRDGLGAATGSDGTIYALGGEYPRLGIVTNEVDVYPGNGVNTAVVVDAPLIAAGTTFSTANETLSGQAVATFSDPGGAEPIADYSATIDWGDQSTPIGADRISYDSGTGQFTVLGSHTYASTGNYSISVSIHHESAPVATATTMAQIGSLPPTASLSGTVFEDFNNDGQVDFGEKGISGVSIALTGTDDLGHAVNLSQTTDGDGAYVFLNLRPGSYYLTEVNQPSGYTPGIDSVGSAGGQLSAADQFFVQLAQGVNGLNYNYGKQPTGTGAVQQGQTAGIGFWNNKHGQALILAFNGGAGHELGDWLAATLVNLYGAKSANDLAGRNNAYVASLFQQDFLLKGQKLDAQVLATALSVYATNATLDNTNVAAGYGFTVGGDGVGTATVNVGANGGAFGVANNTTMTVIDLLLAADAQAVNGVLYNGNGILRNEAGNVFSAVNHSGAIG